MKMVQRMKNTRVGRLVCRLFGEEKGAVMMEYVIVAVLIAAAAVAAVSYFGKDIVAMFNTAGTAATGNSTQAGTMREAARDARGDGDKKGYSADAVTSNGKFSDVGEKKQQQQ